MLAKLGAATFFTSIEYFVVLTNTKTTTFYTIISLFVMFTNSVTMTIYTIVFSSAMVTNPTAPRQSLQSYSLLRPWMQCHFVCVCQSVQPSTQNPTLTNRPPPHPPKDIDDPNEKLESKINQVKLDSTQLIMHKLFWPHPSDKIDHTQNHDFAKKSIENQIGQETAFSNYYFCDN